MKMTCVDEVVHWQVNRLMIC